MGEKREYIGFRLKQRKDSNSVNFFVFAACPKDIIRWSCVNRQEERPRGVERRLSPARQRAITKFFTDDKVNTIPTCVVLAFKPASTAFASFPEESLGKAGIQAEYLPSGSFEWGILSFEFDPEQPEIERPAFVVDGQHRLFGMNAVEHDEIPILVSALIDAEPDEQAFQFIVINNKVRRMPSDLVRSLIVDFNEDDLQKRLKTARVSLQPRDMMVAIIDDDPESPFYQMVRCEKRAEDGNTLIDPKAVEGSLKYFRYRFLDFDDDEDALIDFFFAMWQGVKDAYSDLWKQADNRLFDNAGFKSLSEYLADAIETFMGIEEYIDVDIYDPGSVRDTCRTIASHIDMRFWQAEWKLKSLDTSSGRETIKNDIKLIRQNRKNRKEWSENLALI